MPIEKTCERCGQSFKVRPRNADQRFCGFACKRAHESEHGRENARVEMCSFTCQVCGEPFQMKPAYVRAYQKKWGKDPMYCSTKCGGIGRRLPEEAWQVTCIQCGNPMPIQRRPGGTVNRQKRLCSTTCRSLFRRLSYQAHNADQQPTRRIARHGYVRLVIPGKDGGPSRDVFEHRHVMSQHLGRELYPEETVHHRDGNRQHNDLSNLELFSSRHGPGQRVVDKVAFAIDMLRLYPEFARAAGVELRDVAHPTASDSARPPAPPSPSCRPAPPSGPGSPAAS